MYLPLEKQFLSLAYSHPAVREAAHYAIHHNYDAVQLALRRAGFRMLTPKQAEEWYETGVASPSGKPLALRDGSPDEFQTVMGFVNAGIEGAPFTGVFYVREKTPAWKKLLLGGRMPTFMHELKHVDQVMTDGVAGMYPGALLSTCTAELDKIVYHYQDDPEYIGINKAEMAPYLLTLIFTPGVQLLAAAALWMAFF
jgi:hypothetical protein